MNKTSVRLLISFLAVLGATSIAQGLRSTPVTMKELTSQQYTRHAKGISSYCSINTNTESAYPDTLVRSVGENFNTVMINFNHRIITLTKAHIPDADYINSPMILWSNPEQKILLALELSIKHDPQDKMNEVGTGYLSLVTPKVKETYIVNYDCLN